MAMRFSQIDLDLESLKRVALVLGFSSVNVPRMLGAERSTRSQLLTYLVCAK